MSRQWTVAVMAVLVMGAIVCLRAVLSTGNQAAMARASGSDAATSVALTPPPGPVGTAVHAATVTASDKATQALHASAGYAGSQTMAGDRVVYPDGVTGGAGYVAHVDPAPVFLPGETTKPYVPSSVTPTVPAGGLGTSTPQARPTAAR